jgi:hypothetical protein
MNADFTRKPIVEPEDNPVDSFSDCHAGILSGLREFSSLPPLHEAGQRAIKLAQHTLELLDHAVMEHHAQEEEELFPAVLRSAIRGEEHDQVQSLVWRLTDEHREIEQLWKRMRPDVVHAAAGKPGQLRSEAVDLLVDCYRQHANFEEREFLPLAQEILGRDGNHMAALGMSLHMRHVAVPMGYI